MSLPNFFVVLVLLLVCTRPLEAQWSEFDDAPFDTTRHDDIHFVNDRYGWTSKGSSIYGTTNAGTNWNLKLFHPGTHFRCIGFASESRGWAGNLGAGSYDGNVIDTNVLYQTFDGGGTWSVVPGINETGMRGLCAMHVLDSQHIFGGGRVRGPAYFIKTTDGGTNWTVSNLTEQGVMGAIMDVYFKDPLNGFVVGMDTNQFAANCNSPYSGRIAKTTDGGVTWTPVVANTQSCSYFWKMSWPSEKVGYASLQLNGTRTNVVFYKTIDGGDTWTSNSVSAASFGASTFFVQGIGFANEELGWMGGDSGSAPRNFIQTTNGGLTWSSAGYNNTRSINRIRFLSPTLGYASGQQIHIYKTALGIGNHPESQTVLSGTNITLSVKAAGEEPISYQWQKNGNPITGATDSSLTLTNVTRNETGSYLVQITNTALALQSRTVMIRVLTKQQLMAPILISGEVQLLFSDEDGNPASSNVLDSLTVQTSSNLIEWLPLTNGIIITNDSYQVTHPASAEEKLFYRTIED